ncbi:lipid A deacylase LpxR family protein [Arenibaculum pallidiluteum]|uniref:lipid A deacylase LpxR family protein n=1 Tax=Arenibaculum pallidiluteum TaxID=2812559 RepID=UPI001A975D4A|nr:lipid A deacylase LpxR family protein [Arenibaculum pallidiluteum]
MKTSHKALLLRLRAIPFALALGACAGASGTVNIQNDAFLGGTDRHYTNGLYFGALGAPPQRLAETAKAILPEAMAGRELLAGAALSQQMYTPSDIGLRPPDPDDRPYAGWLFGRLSLVAAEAPPPVAPAVDAPAWRLAPVDRFDLDVGMVGPYSLAADTQRWWHRTWGFQEPRGWGSQIQNEPGLVASWERSLPLRGTRVLGPLDVELTPHVTASLGNVFTFAGAGGTVRIGQNLPRLLGAPLLRSIGGALPERGDEELGWYVFAGTEGRAVARNLFLDGNTFRDNSPDVDRSTFVADVQVGAGLTFGRWRLTYVQSFRTQEFRGQDFGDSFGSVLLSFPLGPAE